MNWIIFLVNLFAENNAKQPVRLAKQPKRSLREKIDLWVSKNFYLIVLATFILIWVGLTLIFFTAFNSTVESGNYYYHIKGVI